MSSVAIQGNSSGAGVFTITSPNSASSYTATLPAATTTLVGTDATQTLTNKTLTTPNIDSAQFATVSGTAPIYPCRAWVNFTGSTGAILASGNVSSVTRSATGQYVVNFTTAIVDANYTIASTASNTGGNRAVTFYQNSSTAQTTSSCAMWYYDSVAGTSDPSKAYFAIFR
jgi:hypothetical protein